MLQPSLNDSITDVAGIHVGHFTLAEGEIQTGVTAILPYPLQVRNRKLFIGCHAGGSWQEWTGLHVAQDFGTFSSPVVLCNSTTVGIAYDALISFGHQREKDLPIDNAWPPVVIGVDDGYLNDLRQRRVTHDDVLGLIHASDSGAMTCGSVGIGRGLCAFGGKGGVGDAARRCEIEGSQFTAGVFIVANGGLPVGKAAAASVTPSFITVVATDAPCLPPQLRRFGEASVRALDRWQLLTSADQRLALAFSTTNTVDGAFQEQFRLFTARWPAPEMVAVLQEAVVECTLAALRKALPQALSLTGKGKRTALPVDLKALFSQTQIQDR